MGNMGELATEWRIISMSPSNFQYSKAKKNEKKEKLAFSCPSHNVPTHRHISKSLSIWLSD